MSLRLIARMGMFVSPTSDLVTNEALIVMHVLHLLGRRELDGIHVHSVGVVTRGGRLGLVSFRGNIGMIPRLQLLESLGDIVELTGLGEPVLVHLWLVFQRCHLEGKVSRHCLP